MKPLVLFTGPVVTRSGYGAHARDLVKSLIKMDKFEIHINSLRWGNTPWNALNLQNEEDKLILDRILKEPNLPREPDIHIQVSIPSEFTPLAKYNIGVTAGMENTAPVPSWVDGMNKMDMVICTSNFKRDTLKKVFWVNKGNPHVTKLRAALVKMLDDKEAIADITKKVGKYDWFIGSDYTLMLEVLRYIKTDKALKDLVWFQKNVLGYDAVIK